MRIIAFILNVAFLLLLVFLLITEPPPSNEWWVFLLPLYPVVNLIALSYIVVGTNNWLCLYLKRKALEEQKKIENLATDKQPEDDQKQ